MSTERMSTGRIAVAGLLTGVVAGVLSAAPAANAAVARTYLVLTIRVTGEKTQQATLWCDPPRGTHPHATGACAALADANGDPAALKPRPGNMCTAIYRPVVAAA